MKSTYLTAKSIAVPVNVLVAVCVCEDTVVSDSVEVATVVEVEVSGDPSSMVDPLPINVLV